MLIFLLLVSGVYAADKEDVLQVLNDFYQTAMNEDLEGYIATQDPIYLDLITEGGIGYRDYFAAAFELTDVKDSTPTIQDVEIEGDMALVFYNLKGSATITETGEIKEIDNDMVAFLWHYADGWKVRWTITQTLYQYKIESEILSSVAAELTLTELDDTTLRDEMISEGLISMDKIINQADDIGSGDAATKTELETGVSVTLSESADGKSAKSNNKVLLAGAAILIIAAFFVWKKQLIPMNKKIAVLIVVLLLVAIAAISLSGRGNTQPNLQPSTTTPPRITQAPQTTSPPRTRPATMPPATVPETTPPPTLPPETSPPTTAVIQTTTITLPPTTIVTTTTSSTTITTTSTTTSTTTTTEPQPTLEVVDETIVSNVNDMFWLGGKVRNNGESDVFSVKVRLTLYNEQGAVMQILNSLPIDQIQSNEAIEFNVIKSDKVTSAVARYEVSIHTGE